MVGELLELIDAGVHQPATLEKGLFAGQKDPVKDLLSLRQRVRQLFLCRTGRFGRAAIDDDEQRIRENREVARELADHPLKA